MARFDVYPDPDGRGYLMDCQADLFSGLNTRLTVPLMPPELAPVAGARLNPSFTVRGARHVMVTQYAAAVPLVLLGPAVASLKAESYTITNALDVLITGI